MPRNQSSTTSCCCSPRTPRTKRRAEILSNVQTAIERGGGSITRDDDWGTRPLPYRIRHQREAEYHLLQFNAPPDLLEGLSHDLHITDGVLRFRIIRTCGHAEGARHAATGGRAGRSRARRSES